jgi:hypothetical protein
MKKYLIIVVILLAIASCGKKEPAIVYSDSVQPDSLSIDSLYNDTTKLLVAELPIYIDSINYLIHPIGLIHFQQRSTKIIESSFYGSGEYIESTIESSSRDYFYGNMSNLVFEEKASGKQLLLTDKLISIKSFQYLRSLSKRNNQHYILYWVYDNDFNKDGDVNSEDLSALYIGNIDGTGFKKINKKLEKYESGVMFEKDLRYYYKTTEDSNKDGIFNRYDKSHFYYIDFSKTPFSIIEYYPLALITQLNDKNAK